MSDLILICTLLGDGIAMYALYLSKKKQGPKGEKGDTGPLGPIGPRGPQGLSAAPNSAIPLAMSPEHAVCGSCGKLVARYSLTPKGAVCANCAPLK